MVSILQLRSLVHFLVNDAGPRGASLVRLVSAFALLGALTSSCGHARQATGDEVVPQLALEVYNSSFFDVNIYGMPSISSTRVRIGTAHSFVTTIFPIPSAAYRSGGSLVLQLHAIGTNSWWTTQELPLSWDLTPCLEIRSDASGRMSTSSWYSVSTTDSTPGKARRTACGFMNPVSDAAFLRVMRGARRLTK